MKLNFKNWKLAMLLSLFGMLLSTQGIAGDTTYRGAYYRQKMDFFRQIKPLRHSIVFLGNSITEVGEWQELIPNKPVLNRGISGDVSYGVLARAAETAMSKPDKIFLLIGINDIKIGTPLDTIISNYKQIINALRETSPHTQIYVQSVLPVNEAMLANIYRRLNNHIIRQFNSLLKTVCTNYKVDYIDLHPLMEDENGQLKKDWSTDGLHLRSAAYVNWVNTLKKQKAL